MKFNVLFGLFLLLTAFVISKVIGHRFKLKKAKNSIYTE